MPPSFIPRLRERLACLLLSLFALPCCLAADATGPVVDAVLPAQMYLSCKPEVASELDAVKPLGSRLVAAGCLTKGALAEYQAEPTLVGAGDIVVAVTRDSWKQPTADARLRISFNGTDVSDDILQVSAEPLGQHVFLTLRLNPGNRSRALWATLIRDAGMTAVVPLSVALAWSGTEPGAAVPLKLLPRPTIAVSTQGRLAAAIVLVLLFGVASIVGALKFGVLLDAAPAAVAAMLAKAAAVRRAWKPRFGTFQQYLLGYYPAYAPNKPKTPNYVPGMPEVDLECAADAELALSTETAPVPDTPAIVGIIEGKRGWSYSLGSTQLFAWFVFTLLAGIFFWTVYRQFPPIDNSVLELLGISVGTAGVAWVIDKNPQRRVGGPSLGFFSDLITDPDSNGRVHRFQCVFVNAALLLVGTANVVYDIVYPTFEPTWLIFLAISGVTYTAGKGLRET
ncbi:MAG: hypothetical protein ACJ8LG_08265 [Massilia sp.]